jgi:hypothetical protein
MFYRSYFHWRQTLWSPLIKCSMKLAHFPYNLLNFNIETAYEFPICYKIILWFVTCFKIMRKLYSNSLSIPLFLGWLIQLWVSPRFYASPWISIYICLPSSMPVHGFQSTYVSPVLCQSMDFNLHKSWSILCSIV